MPQFSFEHQTYTADVASRFTFGTKTFVPGGVVTISGVQISYGTAGSDLVIASKTVPLDPQRSFGGQFSPTDLSSKFAFGTKTLTPSAVITANGSVISYGSAGTDVVIAGITKYREYNHGSLQ